MGKSKASREKERKRKERRDRTRREKHESRFGGGGRSLGRPVPASKGGIAAERSLRLMDALTPQETATEEDVQAALRRLVGRNIDELAVEVTDPVERAQQLAYDAMEASDLAMRREKATAALVLDSRNVEARRLLLLDELRDGADLAEERLIALADDAAELLDASESTGDVSAGEAWHHVRARPLLRALWAGGVAAGTVERFDDAARILDRLLDADHEDHLYAAPTACATAFRIGDFEKARRYIARLARVPVSGWLHAVERFANGDQLGARSLFICAIEDEPELFSAVLDVMKLQEGDSPASLGIDRALAADAACVMNAVSAMPGCLSVLLEVFSQLVGRGRE